LFLLAHDFLFSSRLAISFFILHSPIRS
jgi:hypothetical protein